MRFDLSYDSFTNNREAIKKREEDDKKKLALRYERAWEVIRKAASILKDTYCATRVMVFGSLVHGYWFSPTSDIDLAAWGLSDEDYFLVVARLQDISPEFKIDLIQVENCKPGLLDVILREGKQV
ncbi:MAG: nucleotidyltransferase domain-containing protein [Anaerolineales bacterium]|nr:nucleotidyltransferase domain-containing protein [Anaerolineales bacterium]